VIGSMLPSVGSIVGIVSSFRISDFSPPLVATPEIQNQLLINPFLTKVPFRVPSEGYKKGLRYRPQPSVNQWRKCMGIEPTWDSPHCPTPDLKSKRSHFCKASDRLQTRSITGFFVPLFCWEMLGNFRKK